MYTPSHHLCLIFHIFPEKEKKENQNAKDTHHHLPLAHAHPQRNMIHILSFTPPPSLTHEPQISIIINICLFNFQLCHNVSA